MERDPCLSRPAHEVSRDLANGAISSVELVQATLAEIQRRPDLGAFVEVYAEDALAAAAAADTMRRAGNAVGPWHGLPVALKDNIELEGRVTTSGSQVWRQRVSATSATVARRLTAAGMVIIGKTHLVEFAMGSFGTNQHLGTPRNPRDATAHRAPGGSSSGSGVAVAAGLVPWAVGTDTGGSVRIPASWCGITGLKPTVGRVSCHGVIPLSTTLDTPGPMARCVEDVAHLYRVLAGPDPDDPRTLHLPPDNPERHLRRGVAGLRLARLPATERRQCSPDVLDRYDSALTTLEGLGASIVDVDLPRSFRDLAELTGRLIGAEGYAHLAEIVDDPSLPVDEAVRPRLWLGRGMTAREYIDLLRERRDVQRGFAATLAGVDGLLTPTTPTVAPLVESIDQSGTAAGLTRAANFLDLCALAVPSGTAADGMPTSLQVICRGFEESTALRVGWALEQALDQRA